MVLKSKLAAKRAAAAASNDGPQLVCTAQQSRFDATVTASREIDIKDLSMSLGERDLIVGAHLRLKQGTRYALIGRNGTGKTSLFNALAQKLIPGLPPLRILLLSQVEDSARSDESSSVLDHVVRGDKERLRQVDRFDALTIACETTSLLETTRIVRRIQLEDRIAELTEAQLIAARRSGTRGKAARDEEIQAEERVTEAEERLKSVSTDDLDSEIISRANEMLLDVQANLDLLETSTTEARAATILVGLGFTQEMINGPFSALSGGWRSRCSLATSLLVKSDVLLLDEVTNFLDLEATIWLEGFLSDSEASADRTLVAISHDQTFLSNVVEETIILRNQKLIAFDGTPAQQQLEEKKEARRLLGAKEALDKKRAHIEKSIAQGAAAAKATGNENLQRMVKSRQKKLDDRFGIETSAKGTRFKLNRDLAGYHLTSRADLVMQDQERKVRLQITDPEPLRTVGDLIHFDSVEFTFPRAKAPLLSDVTFTIEQGGRIAFVGANGNGKTTLAKLILGELKPTKGKIVRHPLLRIGHFSQHSVEELSLPVSALSLDDQPVTALSHFMDHFESLGQKVLESDARAFLGSLGLQGGVAASTRLSDLSGGQKVRLALALIIFNPPPLLLLDEVSTHLDFSTVQALAVALRSYSGAVVLITHDRHLSKIVIEGQSSREALGLEQDSDNSSDEEEAEIRRGKTYRVGNGGIRVCEKGMDGYVRTVEKKLAKRERERL